jgi:hypothetical protein
VRPHADLLAPVSHRLAMPTMPLAVTSSSALTVISIHDSAVSAR